MRKKCHLVYLLLIFKDMATNKPEAGSQKPESGSRES